MAAHAIIDPDQTMAVTQQIVAYAILIAVEGFWATWRMEAQPGKPNVFQTIGAIVSLLAVTAAMQSEGLQTQAEIAGMAISAVLLAYYVKRAFDVRDPEGLEWPGPKASPGGMALVAFFSLNIFFQSFRGV